MKKLSILIPIVVIISLIYLYNDKKESLKQNTEELTTKINSLKLKIIPLSKQITKKLRGNRVTPRKIISFIANKNFLYEITIRDKGLSSNKYLINNSSESGYLAILNNKIESCLIDFGKNIKTEAEYKIYLHSLVKKAKNNFIISKYDFNTQICPILKIK